MKKMLGIGVILGLAAGFFLTIFAQQTPPAQGGRGRGGRPAGRKVVLAWAVVGIPLAWGVYRTLIAAAKFFH